MAPRAPFFMRISLVTDGIYPYVVGGMQKHSYYLLKHLSEKMEVDLYHFKTHNTDRFLKDLFPQSHTNIHECIVPFPAQGKLPLHYLRASKEYSRLLYHEFLKRPMPDLILAKGFAAHEFVERKKRGEKLPPVLVNFHGYEMFQKAFTTKDKIIQKLLRKPVKYISQNADFCFSYGAKITEILKDQLRIDEKSILEFPSGIEKKIILNEIPHHGDQIRFCFIGRNERRKGLQELNEALRTMNVGFNWSFDFIGPIPHEMQIGSPNIKYHGLITEQEKIFGILQECDVLVCPSWSEGMPNVILEAMANGLAVMATDVGATSLLVSAETGWLIKNASGNEIKSTLETILSNGKDVCDKKRKAALQLVATQFNWEKISKNLIYRLEDIVKDGK